MNDDVGVSIQTQPSAPTTWPAFVVAPPAQTPEVTLHQIESLGGKTQLVVPAQAPTAAAVPAARG